MTNSRLLRLALFSLILTVAATALADVPALMSYQGRLTDSLGQPRSIWLSRYTTIASPEPQCGPSCSRRSL